MAKNRLLYLAIVVALTPAFQTQALDLFQVGVPQPLAGGGVGEGGLATQVSLLPQDIAAGGDGTLYIADEQYNRVRAAGPDGRVRTLVGSGEYGYNGDGLPALESSLYVPSSLCLGPAGRLYLVDLGNRQVRRLEADGKLRTVVDARHRVLAAAPQPFAPSGLAVDPQGRVCVADRGNNRVWQFDPDGKGRPVAGNGERGFSGDGDGSALARLADPRAVLLGADGSIYIADLGNRRVRRVGPDGNISTVAGNGREDDWDGTRPALEASLRPADLELDAQGRLLILDQLGPRLLRLEADGSVAVVARLQAAGEPQAVTVDGQGQFLVAEYSGRQVRRVDADGRSLCRRLLLLR